MSEESGQRGKCVSHTHTCTCTYIHTHAFILLQCWKSDLSRHCSASPICKCYSSQANSHRNTSAIFSEGTRDIEIGQQWLSVVPDDSASIPTFWEEPSAFLWEPTTPVRYGWMLGPRWAHAPGLALGTSHPPAILGQRQVCVQVGSVRRKPGPWASIDTTG